MAAADILDFQKFKILTIDPPPAANMRHHTKCYQNRKIGQTVTEIWQFNSFFQNAGRPPSLICWTTGDEVLVVCIIVPTLAKNRFSSFDNLKLSIFCRFRLKMPIHA